MTRVSAMYERGPIEETIYKRSMELGKRLFAEGDIATTKLLGMQAITAAGVSWDPFNKRTYIVSRNRHSLQLVWHNVHRDRATTNCDQNGCMSVTMLSRETEAATFGDKSLRLRDPFVRLMIQNEACEGLGRVGQLGALPEHNPFVHSSSAGEQLRELAKYHTKDPLLSQIVMQLV